MSISCKWVGEYSLFGTNLDTFLNGTSSAISVPDQRRSLLPLPPIAAPPSSAQRPRDPLRLLMDRARRLESAQRAYDIQVRAGSEGAAKFTCLGLGLAVIGHHTWPFFRWAAVLPRE